MRERTSRALEHLLAVPPLPMDETSIVAWAVAVNAALDELTGALVRDGYAERVPVESRRCRFDVNDVGTESE